MPKQGWWSEEDDVFAAEYKERYNVTEEEVTDHEWIWGSHPDQPYKQSRRLHFRYGLKSRGSRKAGVAFGLLIFLGFVFFSQRSNPTTSIEIRNMPKMAWTSKRKALVVAGMASQNITWLSDLPLGWETFNYIVDDPSAPLSVPVNRGREAMPYVTYIVDNYDNLPDYSVFVHGHYVAWHQEQPLPMLIRALNLATVDKLGWTALRCTASGRCRGPADYVHPNDVPWDPSLILRSIHSFVFRPEDSWYEPLPDALAAECCAQFAVSKRQIQSRPLEFWSRLHTTLLRQIEGDEFEGMDEERFSWLLGGAFEISWHWLFGKAPVLCMDEDTCYNDLYDNKIVCDGDTRDWDVALGQQGYKNITCVYTE